MFILDLSALRCNYPSMFDSKFSEKLKDIKFLEKFSYEISRPILPEDENIDYIPTQAITEFISNHLEQKIDGIIYPSTQTDGLGKNVVIFNPIINSDKSQDEINKEVIIKLSNFKPVKIYYSQPKFTEYY